MSFVSDDQGSAAVARLVDTDGRSHPLTGPQAVVGRGAEAEVQIDHPDISRRHARLTVSEDGVLVEDLESKNGVFINGGQLLGPERAVDGDLISLGGADLRLVHPSSQLRRALAERGEATITRVRPAPSRSPAGPGMALPLIGVAIFAALVAAMLLL